MISSCLILLSFFHYVLIVPLLILSAFMFANLLSVVQTLALRFFAELKVGFHQQEINE